jgi:hypothetical protein
MWRWYDKRDTGAFVVRRKSNDGISMLIWQISPMSEIVRNCFPGRFHLDRVFHVPLELCSVWIELRLLG